MLLDSWTKVRAYRARCFRGGIALTGLPIAVALPRSCSGWKPNYRGRIPRTCTAISRSPGWYASTRVDGSAEDRAFIAHARTDVPALLAEVRRLRALIHATAGSVEDAYRTAIERQP